MTIENAEKLDTFKYTVADVIEAEPYDICRLWVFRMEGGNSEDKRCNVSLYISQDTDAIYTDNMSLDGGRTVELEEVPTYVKTMLAERLNEDIDELIGNGVGGKFYKE